jgi:hypothetical protein
VRAAIVLGDDLDVLMTVAAPQLILDAEIGEVDRLVEVRQVVFVRPVFYVDGPQITACGLAVSERLAPRSLTLAADEDVRWPEWLRTGAP